MIRFAAVSVAGLALALAVCAAEAPAPPEGTWRLLLPTDDGQMRPRAVLELKLTDGKWSAKVLDKDRRISRVEMDNVTVTDGILRASLRLGGGPLRFEAPVPKDKDARIRGGIIRRGNVSPVELEPTTVASLDDYEIMKETVAKQTAGYDQVRNCLTLLSQAAEKKAKPEEVRSWAAKAVKSAEAYGPAWHRSVVLAAAEILGDQKGFEAIALNYARQAERLMTDKDGPAFRKKVLDALAAALAAGGKKDEAKEVRDRIGKLDFSIQTEPYPGRKGKGDRVVLVELFTGAQCPPCVAADLAFDALGKAFKPTEVVRLQYHLHVPGPDPLTSPDADERARFYAKAVEGTPTALFNGRPLPVGGGGREDAQETYDEYMAALPALLHQTARAKVSATAKREGTKVTIAVEASADKGAGERPRLRCVLVEEEVDYTGANGVAKHHHVVRSFPGGVEGMKLTAGNSIKKSLTVDLAALKKDLTTYLDKVAEDTPFPKKDRPMDLKKLRVVAFVQDDATNEVLQAAQADVTE